MSSIKTAFRDYIIPFVDKYFSNDYNWIEPDDENLLFDYRFSKACVVFICVRLFTERFFIWLIGKITLSLIYLSEIINDEPVGQIPPTPYGMYEFLGCHYSNHTYNRIFGGTKNHIRCDMFKVSEQDKLRFYHQSLYRFSSVMLHAAGLITFFFWTLTIINLFVEFCKRKNQQTQTRVNT